MSALIARGPPSRVIEASVAGRIELLIPVHALTELQRVLSDKLGFTPGRASDAVGLLEGLAAEVLDLPHAVEAMSGDPDDDVILASVLEGGAEVLVTGDRRHLLPLERVGQLRLLTPQALLAELA